jgi:hypothetical protein
MSRKPRKKHGPPSKGREGFRSEDADILLEVEGHLRKYLGDLNSGDLTPIHDALVKVKGVRDWHYSGTGIFCKPPTG